MALMPGVTGAVRAALEPLVLLFYVWTPGRLAQRGLGEFLENISILVQPAITSIYPEVTLNQINDPVKSKPSFL